MSFTRITYKTHSFSLYRNKFSYIISVLFMIVLLLNMVSCHGPKNNKNYTQNSEKGTVTQYDSETITNIDNEHENHISKQKNKKEKFSDKHPFLFFLIVIAIIIAVVIVLKEAVFGAAYGAGRGLFDLFLDIFFRK